MIKIIPYKRTYGILFEFQPKEEYLWGWHSENSNTYYVGCSLSSTSTIEIGCKNYKHLISMMLFYKNKVIK